LQFGLRTLLILLIFVALAVLLWIVGGSPILTWASIVGVGIGGAIAILGSNKQGNTPWVIIGSATLGSLMASILGVGAVGFDVADYDNPLGKAPIGSDYVFWWTFWGALSGAVVAAIGAWLAKQEEMTK
jgi:hypothetical protein